MDLEKFAKKIFELSGWPEGGNIEGDDLQAIAVECGLLIPEMQDGVTFYRKCESLLTTAPSADSEQAADFKKLNFTIQTVNYEATAAFIESNSEAIQLAINLLWTARRD